MIDPSHQAWFAKHTQRTSSIFWAVKSQENHRNWPDIVDPWGLLMSMLTTYLTPYATLVHQGNGTKYPR